MSRARAAVSTYRATVERDDPGWIVDIDGLAAPKRFHARDLADVEPRARKLIWGYTGQDIDAIEIDVDIRLPVSIRHRLELVRKLSADLDSACNLAIIELIETGLSLLDVGRVLARHHRPPRPLTVTNAEVAEHGLDRHPEAMGLEWDDHGFAVTKKCRRHVEASRRSYRDLPPEDESAIIYPGVTFRCDFCHEGDDQTDEVDGPTDDAELDAEAERPVHAVRGDR